MTPFHQTLGNSEKGKVPSNKKKPLAELGLGRGDHLLWQIGGEGRETGQKTDCGGDPEFNIN